MEQRFSIKMACAGDGGMPDQLFVYIVAREEEHVQTHGSSIDDTANREQILNTLSAVGGHRAAAST
ncbi:hypothetical protein [Cnuella takakiae]|nr:hypothetical protein [Cnuella takakiae]OLY91153.1 hypothetical protein BUE76_03975 [Cnuella takakiae]